MKKVLYTLNLDNAYAPEITALTYPLLQRYADKIEAEFQVISERRFPGWPITYEKLQIYDLGHGNDWNIFIDSDAVVHPDMWDVTDHLGADTVAHNGRDLAGNRWRYDNYFRRDGRHIGSCNWFTVASNWCIDLWKPLDDLTLEEALANISPTPFEAAAVSFKTGPDGKRLPDGKGGFQTTPKAIITPEHLIDDYVLSRNIAKFGLKFISVMEIQRRLNDTGNYLWHAYTVDVATKTTQIKDVLDNWQIGHLGVRKVYA